MAFYYSGDPQVRLRFSRHAEEVIQNDMFFFQETRRNSFINTILENFYTDANASISLRLDAYHDFLISQFSSSDEAKQVRPFINKLIDAKKIELLRLSKGYDTPQKSGSNQPLRLRKKFYEFMTDEQTGTREDAFYDGSLPKYLRTLIEEYTRLPYVERERIYYKPIFSIIETALIQQCQLLITASNNTAYHVLPYKLMTDPLATANYLSGFSYELDADKTTKRTCSFRISVIRNIKLEKSRSGYLHPKDLDLLNHAISQQGVQFLISDQQEIKVRFSEQGLYMFTRQIYLRPTPLEPEPIDNTYTFRCSMAQAKFYFLKFGKDAEILAPETLRTEFIENYKNALENYCCSSN